MENMKYILIAATCIALWSGTVKAQDFTDTDTLSNISEVATEETTQPSYEYDSTPNVIASQEIDVEKNVEDNSSTVSSDKKSGKLTKEEKRQIAADKKAQKKAAKEEKCRLKAEKKAQKKAEKEKKKLAKSNSNIHSNNTNDTIVAAPTANNQQQLEEEIAELKRAQETLTQQLEYYARNQETILEAVKAAQDAATEATKAARTAQNTLMMMQQNREVSPSEKNKAAEKKTLTAARKEAGSLIFKIQISARHSKFDDVNAQFAQYGLGMKVTEERHQNDNTFTYKYVVGSYKQVDTAVEACNLVREKGIMDAFVVAYYKGRRISMTEAFNMLNKN